MENCDCPFLVTALGNSIIKMIKRNILSVKDIYESQCVFTIQEEEERFELLYFADCILSFIQSNYSNDVVKKEVVDIRNNIDKFLKF